MDSYRTAGVRMINLLNSAHKSVIFSSRKSDKNGANEESKVLPDTLGTRMSQTTQKTMSAFVDYPIKGLRGDVNSNFYEFLTMGIVPYLMGSAMFMVVFNALNLGKHLGAKDSKVASVMGRKMALGVVLYGVMKELSKNFVTLPVKAATGVNIEMPYQNKVYNLPTGAGEDASMLIQWQQRKVFDSKEFYRKDLLDREYFDKVAKRLGLGDNLKDSISETSPIIQNIVATAGTAKSLSSYAWAAVGVALAVQDSWINFFDACSKITKYTPQNGETSLQKVGGHIKNFGKNSWKLLSEFCKDSLKACKQLWDGDVNRKGFMKHSGKALVLFTTMLTAVLTANSIIKAKNMAKNLNANTIDETKESTVI